MMKLRDLIDVFAVRDMHCIQVCDDITGAHFLVDENKNLTLGGDIVSLTMDELLDRTITEIEKPTGYFLLVYVK